MYALLRWSLNWASMKIIKAAMNIQQKKYQGSIGVLLCKVALMESLTEFFILDLTAKYNPLNMIDLDASSRCHLLDSPRKYQTPEKMRHFNHPWKIGTVGTSQ